PRQQFLLLRSLLVLEQLLFPPCCAPTRPFVLRPFVSTTRGQLLLPPHWNKTFAQAERELGLRQSPPALCRIAVWIFPSEDAFPPARYCQQAKIGPFSEPPQPG